MSSDVNETKSTNHVASKFITDLFVFSFYYSNLHISRREDRQLSGLKVRRHHGFNYISSIVTGSLEENDSC